MNLKQIIKRNFLKVDNINENLTKKEKIWFKRYIIPFLNKTELEMPFKTLNSIEIDCLKTLKQKKCPIFKDLFPLIIHPQTLLMAFTKLTKNNVRFSVGIDIQLVNDYSIKKLINLHQRLKANNYKPQLQIKELITQIGKSNLTKSLQLSIDDYIVQEAICIVLKTIYEPMFQLHSVNSGFRKTVSSQEVLKKIYHSSKGHIYAIEGNFLEAYANINNDRILQKLQRNIYDKKLLNLINQFLQARIFQTFTEKDIFTGVSYGNILAQLLLNIFLLSFDEYIENEIKPLIKMINTKQKRTLIGSPNVKTNKIIYQIQKNNFLLKKIQEAENRDLPASQKEISLRDAHSQKVTRDCLEETPEGNVSKRRPRRGIQENISASQKGLSRRDARRECPVGAHLEETPPEGHSRRAPMSRRDPQKRTTPYFLGSKGHTDFNKQKKKILKMTKKLCKIKSKDKTTMSQRINYVRYAGVWIITVLGTLVLTKLIKNKLDTFLKINLGMRILSEKILISNIQKNWACFLGFRIKVQKEEKPILKHLKDTILPEGRDLLAASQKGQKVTMSRRDARRECPVGAHLEETPPEGHSRECLEETSRRGIQGPEGHKDIIITVDMAKIILYLRNKKFLQCVKLNQKQPEDQRVFQSLQQSSWARLSDYAILQRYIKTITKIFKYYKGIVTITKELKWIYYILLTSCAKTLALKYKTHTINKIFKKYGKTLKVLHPNKEKYLQFPTLQKLI